MRFVWVGLLLLSACGREADFASLMGKGTAAWAFVRTEEDRANLARFARVWEGRKEAEGEALIPKTLHFIWLGEKPIPIGSVENMKGWAAIHPDWKIKFWFDRERPLPVAGERIVVGEEHLPHLFRFFAESDNWAEKSDLLRYEILLREGGIYVDHDVKCFRSFAPLIDRHEFFCGLDLPGATPLSSSVHVTNSVIGARAGEVVLEETIRWIEKEWERVGELFPGGDRDSVISRIAHRTFFAFSKAAQEGVERYPGMRMVFPAFYFSAPSDGEAIYARHTYAGSWFEEEKGQFERKMARHMGNLTKKVDRLMGLLGVVVVLLLVLLLRRKALFLLFFGVLSGGEAEWFVEITEQMKCEKEPFSQEERVVLERYAEAWNGSFVGGEAIPKVAHFIWLGPRSFPIESIRRIKSWRKHNPDWRLCFWTDSPISALPVEGMERRLVSEFPFYQLKEEFYESDNWGEKADLLRYEIIYREGGVYVDHDVECVRSFAPLMGLDFFACLEPPHRNPGRRLRIFPGNALFGARPQHPIFLAVMREVKRGWESVRAEYPYADFESETTRVLNRTFNPFSVGVLEEMGKEGRNDLVLPPPYFFYKGLREKRQIPTFEEHQRIYAIHTFCGSWADGRRVDRSPQFAHLFGKEVGRAKRWGFYTLLLLGANGMMVGLLCWRRR